MFSKEFINGDLMIDELCSLQSEIWNEKNIKLFGLSVNNSTSPFMINTILKSNQAKYWNEGSCLLKERLLEEKSFLKDKAYLIENTWELSYNSLNNFVKLSCLFVYEASENGRKLNKKNELPEFVEKINELSEKEKKEIFNQQSYQGINFIVSKSTLLYMPLVTTLGYRLKNSDYSLRVQAVRNPFLLRKINGVVRQKGWEFSNGEFLDGENHFKDVNELNYPFLNAILGKQVNEDNFKEALEKMPEYDSNSLLYFNFHWFDEIEKTVLFPKRKSINAEKGKVINYVSLINSPSNQYVAQNLKDKELYTNLVIVKNKIKSLEICRNVVFSPTSYVRSFSFNDSEKIFDAFKVTTNGAAGRSRILLDNFYVENEKLCLTFKGKTYTHYDVILGNIPEEIKQQSNLSCLSRAPYNYLNDAKRIMFCAKLRTQAVRVKGQKDDFSHEVPARVVFADWKGFNFGDSFVISESFAKKLERSIYKRFSLPRAELQKYEVGQKLSIEDLVELDYKNRYSSWRDIHVEEITNDDIKIVARTPFGVGDKISNMHGSKGIVSLILPDEQMPILQNDLSNNMPSGAVDIIVPGISVFRRKSTGQVFEAVTSALEIKEMPLQELQDKYGKALKKFDENSLFKMQGEVFKAPCGINSFIRLDHDATSKQSFAYIKTNPQFNLHIAEMELLNLAARGKYNILNELDLRSLNKHTNSFKKIKNLQEKSYLEDEPMNTTALQDYMKYLGWKINFEGNLSKEEIDGRWKDLFEIVSNKEVNIFN